MAKYFSFKAGNIVLPVNLLLSALAIGLYISFKKVETTLIIIVLMLFIGMIFSKGDTVAYVCKRVLLALLTMLIISAVTFFAMNAIPGGPFSTEKALDPTVKATLEKRFNIDKPIFEQYLLYLNNVIHGDMGLSIKTGRDISGIIGESFKISARIGGSAILLALFVGLCFGSIAAIKNGKMADRTIIFFTTLFVAVPSFILATLLMLIFCLKLNWVPVFSISNTNFILPIISLALYPLSYITRLTKSSMLDVLSQDYIRTARAKGVKESLVIAKHALKNALIPVITYIGPLTAYILTGSMVVETVFTIGGLGTKFVTGIVNRDYSLIMGCTLFLSALMVSMTLLSDLVYKLVDPKISFK